MHGSTKQNAHTSFLIKFTSHQ